MRQSAPAYLCRPHWRSSSVDSRVHVANCTRLSVDTALPHSRLSRQYGTAPLKCMFYITTAYSEVNPLETHYFNPILQDTVVARVYLWLTVLPREPGR